MRLALILALVSMAGCSGGADMSGYPDLISLAPVLEAAQIAGTEPSRTNTAASLKLRAEAEAIRSQSRP